MSYPYPQSAGGYRPTTPTSGYPYQPGQPGAPGGNAWNQHASGYPQPQGGYPQSGYPAPQQQPQQHMVPPGVDPNVYHWFLAVDSDRSGRISAKELQLALVNGNWSTFSEDACRMMIGMFDRQRYGTIDATEFQGLWNYLQQWRSVFERYDSDRSGYIDQSELERAVAEMGFRLSPQFYTAIIQKYDPRNRQRIGLDDFIVFMVHLQLFTNSFRERDTARTGSITIGYEDFLSVVFLAKAH